MSKQGFKTEIANLLSTTTQFDGPSKTKLGTRYVALYESRWNAFLEGDPATDTDDKVDSPAVRSQFIADIIVEGMNEIYMAGHVEEIKDTAPPIETLP
jgi:hypothetical protein